MPSSHIANALSAKESGSTWTFPDITFAPIANGLMPSAKPMPRASLPKPKPKPKQEVERWGEIKQAVMNARFKVNRKRGREMHYNWSLYKGNPLLHFADRYFKRLPKDVTLLLSRGASGCAIASALVLYAALNGKELNHIHLRKPGECAHSAHAGPSRLTNQVACIVDDFVSSGETIEEIMETLRRIRMPGADYVLVSRCPFSIEEKLYELYGFKKIIALEDESK